MAVVLFDGGCNLCNGYVRFIIARDPRAKFKFAALGSDAANRALGPPSLRFGGPGCLFSDPLPDSIVLVDDGAVFTRSTAVLRILRRLTFPWPLFYGLIVIPRALRDLAYDAIARRRYEWFGRRDSCMMPSADIRGRFIE